MAQNGMETKVTDSRVIQFLFYFSNYYTRSFQSHTTESYIYASKQFHVIMFTTFTVEPSQYEHM